MLTTRVSCVTLVPPILIFTSPLPHTGAMSPVAVLKRLTVGWIHYGIALPHCFRMSWQIIITFEPVSTTILNGMLWTASGTVKVSSFWIIDPTVWISFRALFPSTGVHSFSLALVVLLILLFPGWSLVDLGQSCVVSTFTTQVTSTWRVLPLR